LAFRLGWEQDEGRFAVDFERFSGDAEPLREDGAVVFGPGRADCGRQIQQAADGDEDGPGVTHDEMPHGNTPNRGSDEWAAARYDATHLVSILSQTAFCLAAAGMMIRVAKTF
jgi:hypothetical protein